MLGIIGGSGLAEYAELRVRHDKSLDTPFGAPSSRIILGELGGESVAFLARHGRPHVIPPHLVNYRANLWVLKELGVTEVIAVNAVGGISQQQDNGVIAVPDQIIDYSWGRESTYSDSSVADLQHIDFTEPYDRALRAKLLEAAEVANITAIEQAIHGVTQGPRLETAAEIRRMAQDGCDIVGMTGMPEAALARELDIPFACLSIVVNKAAGLSDEPITLEDIHRVLDEGIGDVKKILKTFCLLKNGS